MKKILSLLLLLYSIGSQGQETGAFSLRGKLEGLDSGYVYLSYLTNNHFHTDSCRLVQGRFEFKGLVDRISESVFSTYNMEARKPKKENPDFFETVYLEPAEMVLLVDIHQFQDLRIEGCFTDGERANLVHQKKPFWKAIDSVTQSDMISYDENLRIFRESKNQSSKDSAMKKSHEIYLRMETLTKDYNDSMNKMDSVFIVDNPGSFLAANMLWRNTHGDNIHFPSLKNLYEKMPPDIQKSKYGQGILASIAYETHIYTGMQAKNFKAVDSRGHQIELESFRGKKYVLLDFWASWCGPCREINPMLKKMRLKYKNKLELISIANNDKQSDWKKAIQKDQTDWIQILDNPHVNNRGDSVETITDKYYISLIPTLMLIDKNFQVVRIFGGDGKNELRAYDLERELKKIFTTN